MTDTTPEALLMEHYEGLTEDLIAEQIEWETTCVDRGVARYHASLESTHERRDGTTVRKPAAMGDTQAGLWVMRDIVETLLPHIVEERESALQRIDAILTGAPGNYNRPWALMLPLLSAEKLAVIAVRCILTHPIREDKGIGRPVMSIALEIGTSIRDEVEYQQFQEQSKLAKKEGKRSFDLAAVMKQRVSVMDRKRWIRWRKKMDEIENLEWSKEARCQLGARVLDIAIKHGGGWFEQKTLIMRGRTEYRLVLTSVAKQALAAHHEKLEINRPYLLPMVCPPVPWRKLSG